MNDAELLIYLYSRVTQDPSTGCINWDKPYSKGYGRVNLRGTPWQVHRLFWTILKGPIPAGLQLDHLCRNRACCNIAHLEPVTCRENLLRGETLAAENVAKTHCPKGHEYSESNTYLNKNTRRRHCRECMRVASQSWYERSGRKGDRVGNYYRGRRVMYEG